MFFGRNEEEGLRCVYHGWKFDVTGACVDMPSEPAESNFKNKVRATAYPTHERNGIIWAYMGPREMPPPLPDLEANMLPDGPDSIYTILQRSATGCRAGRARSTPSTPPSCTAAPTDAEDTQPGTLRLLPVPASRRAQVQRRRRPSSARPTAPTARPRKTPTTGASPTPLPVLHHDPARARWARAYASRAYVPMDDDHTLQWDVFTAPTAGSGRAAASDVGAQARAAAARLPAQRHRLVRPLPPRRRTWRNDYLIDREAQTHGQSYTGIPGIAPAGHGRHREHGPDLRPLRTSTSARPTR